MGLAADFSSMVSLVSRRSPVGGLLTGWHLADGVDDVAGESGPKPRNFCAGICRGLKNLVIHFI